MIVMHTERGATFLLADDGKVIGRSNGPKGWNYSGQWIIVGFLRRWNGGRVSLAQAADGASIGHGFVRDLDHGTYRQWGERVKSVYRPSDDYAQTLMQYFTCA